MYNWSDDIDPYSSSDMDHSSWMRSDGHRKNILRSNWRSVGIACVYFNGKYRYYWAQEFSPYSAERKVTASGRVNMSMNVDVSADVYNRLIVRGVLDGSQINPDGSSGGNGGSGGDTSKVRGEWKSAGGRSGRGAPTLSRRDMCRADPACS